MTRLYWLIGLAWAQEPIQIDVIPRTSWGKALRMERCVPHQITSVSIHHSATLTKSNADVPKHLLSYQKYHQQQGWMDIAYHFIVDLEGQVFQGRSLDCKGDTFTNYDPTGHLIIMVDGNYNEQELSDDSWKSILHLVQWGMQTYNIPLERIFYHQQLANTECPGKSVIQRFSQQQFTPSINPIVLSYVP